jgi:serine/threonine protein kinase
MERTLNGSNEARPLAELADEIASWSLADRLRLVRRLAEKVEVLHGSGQTHRAIDIETIIVEGPSAVQLADPPARRRFGGMYAGPRFCPPELSLADTVELPPDADVAARLLERAGCAVDPSRIDVYQLGALLCVLFTGEPILKYMVSPKTKNSVPVPVRSVLARAVGFDTEDRLVECRDLIVALDDAIRRVASPATDPDDDTRK